MTPEETAYCDRIWGAGNWVWHGDCSSNGLSRPSSHHKNFHVPGPYFPDVERALHAPSGMPEGDSTPPSGHQRDKETM